MDTDGHGCLCLKLGLHCSYRTEANPSLNLDLYLYL